MQRTFKDLVREARSRITEVSCEELQLGGSIVLDVRESDETRACMLPGAVAVPRGIVERHIGEHVTAKDSRVVV